jgi:5-hydroxyisourate hydrolase
VTLQRDGGGGQWESIGHGVTDADGRLRTLTPAESPLSPGVYRLVFDVAHYFRIHATRTFYPSVTVVFETELSQSHYHVPLLLSPFGYSTYRGS